MQSIDASLDRGYVHHMVRLSMNKTGLKETEHWLPSGLRGQAYHPDAVSTLGRPWIWGSAQGGFRSGPSCWPSYGIGQFVFGWTGKSVLLLCRGSSMLELGISLTRIAERMDRMTPAELEQIIQSGAVVHATLTAATAVWVPYGWFPMVMACPGVGSMDRASGAYLPFFNQDLCFIARATMLHVLDSLSGYEFISDSEQEAAVFKKNVGPVIEWLHSILGEEAESDRSDEDVFGAAEARSGTSRRKRDKAASDDGMSKRTRLAEGDRARSNALSAVQAGGGPRPGVGGHAQGDSSESRKGE